MASPALLTPTRPSGDIPATVRWTTHMGLECAQIHHKHAIVRVDRRLGRANASASNQIHDTLPRRLPQQNMPLLGRLPRRPGQMPIQKSCRKHTWRKPQQTLTDENMPMCWVVAATLAGQMTGEAIAKHSEHAQARSSQDAHGAWRREHNLAPATECLSQYTRVAQHLCAHANTYTAAPAAPNAMLSRNVYYTRQSKPHGPPPHT